MKKFYYKVLIFLVIFGLSACNQPSQVIVPQDRSYKVKSPKEEYQAIGDAIAKHNLDNADKGYLSLRNDYMDSPLLATAMLSLAQAHLLEDEYLLANFYYEEFLKSFAIGEWTEYIQFLQVKTLFLKIKDINKEPKRIEKALNIARQFNSYYQNSRYAPLVKSMIVRLEMAQYIVDMNMAKFYKHIGKKRASEIYINRVKKYSYKYDEINF